MNVLNVAKLSNVKCIFFSTYPNSEVYSVNWLGKVSAQVDVSNGVENASSPVFLCFNQIIEIKTLIGFGKLKHKC